MRCITAGLIVALTAGCAVPRAWVISRSSEGGVVGYSNRAHLFMGDEERRRAMDAALDSATSEVCGGRRYSVLWDRRESELRSYTRTKSVSEESDSKFDFSGYARGNYSGSGTMKTKTTREVPVTENFTVSWREMGISCGLPPSERVPYEPMKPVVRRASAQLESEPEKALCSARDLEEMRTARLSPSAIESACGKSPPVPRASPSLTDAEISQTIAQSPFQRCAEEQRRMDGEGGSLTIRFVVSPNGSANQVSIDSKQGAGTSVTSCWLEVARAVAFSARSEGSEFRIPFKY